MEADAYTEMAALQERHWWFRARREILADIIGQMPTKLAPNGLVLDTDIVEIGCGPGGNLPMLARFGSLTAIEMDARARALAKGSAPPATHILEGMLPDALPIPPQSCDLICLFDVLEHVADDLAALVALRALLRPGGRILITVPAYQWLWSIHDVKLHHFRRYTRSRLASLLHSAGWTIKKISYFNTILFPLAALARVADKVRGATSASGNKLPPAFINETFYHLFAAERFGLRRFSFPFGVSILALAEPSP